MIEQLLNLIQQESTEHIVNNPAIPNDQNNQAMELAAESIVGGLKNALSDGNLNDVMGLFGGDSNQISTSNPLVGGITDNFIGGLVSKFGLDNIAAKGIAASIIPMILGKLVSKTNDSSDSSFNINNIIGALLGAKAGNSGVEIPGGSLSGIDFGGILKNLTSGGLDANKDGKIGLDDLAGVLKNFSSNSQSSNSSDGGILGALKGILGSK
ncbi:MAG: hypothetical protein IT215_07530 [Chitinophagaceae bacterium]|nr:MAG: hypothetical protein UZ11_BCD004000739 [Bacteroidetes bacterium OLB11]MCC6448520.1 hypothetical protein [Chitinophagaceae bacterium]HMN32564.1 hypothetical protein [Chitinophagaceae bacterium]